jgi:voltage-gated potassium channel
MKIEKSSLRSLVHQILEIEHDGMARVINAILMLFIAVTLVIVFIATVPSLNQHYESWIYSFEIVSIAVFSIEYIARVWASAEINPDKPWTSRFN